MRISELKQAGMRRAKRVVARLGRSPAAEGLVPAGYATPIERPRKQCQVCGGESLRKKRIRFHKDATLVCRVQRCMDCGHVRVMRPRSKYRNLTDVSQLPQRLAAGSVERPGREFHMAKMAMDILGTDDLDVLLYGVGTSLDNLHIEKLPEARSVHVGDIMKVRDDTNFIDLNGPPPRQFDVVIASEVVEHFRRPRGDWAHLFKYVKDDGLLVCGTGVNPGGPLNRARYIFFPDHTAFYSPEAIQLIAHAEGWYFDFRPTGGPRKRYILFSRSREVMEKVALYFGREVYAPAEYSRPPRPPVNPEHEKWRRIGQRTGDEKSTGQTGV